MELFKAKKIAYEIKTQLLPYCKYLKVIGSVRLNKPYVKDIKIVCVPKIEVVKIGTFGQSFGKHYE